MNRLFAIAMSLAAVMNPAAAAQLDFTADAVLGHTTLTTAAFVSTQAISVAQPYGLAEDPGSGELWISDRNSHRVLRFASAAAFANGEAANLVLGQANFNADSVNGGVAVAAHTMSGPIGVAVDQSGTVYVADGDNSRVLVFRPPFSNGMNASAVLGQPDFTSAGANTGGLRASTLAIPYGITHARGRLWVADEGNGRVLAFDTPAVTGANAVKVFGQANYSVHVTNVTDAATLRYPVGVNVDRAGNLWVADVGQHRVLRFNAAADNGDAVADLVLCQASFTTDDDAATATTCDEPYSVANDAEGNIYVTDQRNHRVLLFTNLATGAAASAFIGQASTTTHACNRGEADPSAISICFPSALLVDRTGNLLVADTQNLRVLRFDLPRARGAPAITTLAPSVMLRNTAFTLTVNGTGFYAGSIVHWNGSPRPTKFISGERVVAQIAAADTPAAGPYAVTVNNPAPGGGSSNLLNVTTYLRAALDTSADRELGNASFSVNTTYGIMGEQVVGNFNGATLAYPYALAVDPVSGRLFVVDDNRLLSWPDAMAFHNAQSADLVIGQPDFYTDRCNSTGINARSLCTPYALAFDAQGRLYVADSGNNRVLRFSPPFSSTMAADRSFGQGGTFTTGAANNGGRSANSLDHPLAVAISGTTLFVADYGNNRVLVYNDAANDMTADVVIGQASMSVAASGVVSEKRFVAFGLAVDDEGRLYASCENEHRILRFSPPFQTSMSADLVIGQANFTASTPGSTASTLNKPVGMVFDPGGGLYVADSYNHRVLRFAPPFTTGMVSKKELGQAGVEGNGTDRLRYPQGVGIDYLGNLYVADTFNARVLEFARPVNFTLDPAGDIDRDGIPNGVEKPELRDAFVKDNDIFADNRLFAMQQYRDFLGREGDAGGITYYTNLLGSGAAVRANVIESFFASPEFSGIASPVARLYFATFLRAPDYAGLTFQIGVYRSGYTLGQIANNFTISGEFQTRYGALNNAQFVALLYTNILARAASQGEIDYHVNRLNNGLTRGEVLVGFSESPEYQSTIANEVYVTMMYVGMLRRAPDPGGLTFWVNYMDGGNPGLALILGFLNAPEYRNRFLP